MMGSSAGWKGLESGSGRGQAVVRHEVVVVAGGAGGGGGEGLKGEIYG